MEKEPTGIVNVPVDVIDTENEKLLQRDSAMEMEMLELFEDITLEDVVLNKACVGKVMGCKDMPASVVKKILMGIWRNVGGWRMKKCGEGVLGFFFDTEEDCKFIMDKRPWLVNGMLLNLKPWPIEGEVRVADFEVARFWVQFHGLPTRCLSNENAIIIAKKAGQFVKSDDKSKVELVRRGYLRCWLDVWIAHPFVVGFFLKAEGREETWIQFKYEKLPFLCFNYGKLAHLDRVCHVPTAMVFPKNGEAVQMYGPWVKSESGRSNCFSMAGKGITRSLIEPSENALIDRKTKKKGTWRRRHSRKSVGEDDSTLACKKDSEAKVVFDRMVGNFGYVRDPIPIGPNYLDLPNPDFANVGEGKIPDIGPTLAQSLEIPHSWVCASQRPHNYPDEVPIKWPTNDLEMQKAFLALYGRETFDSGFKVNVLDMPGCASWVLFCIYGPPYGDLKQSFWDRMLSKVQGSPLPWALMGDLNLILEAKEKMGGRPFQNARTATYHIRKRLDRVIADSQWCLLFPNASVCHLPIYGSDHAPFCLNVWGINEKLCYPFRFLEVWTSSKECGEVIDRTWAQHIPVWHSNRFQRKLQITKQELKCWNLNKFGFVDRRLKDLKHSLGLIQGAPVTQSLLENEAGIQLEILELEAKMERIWKQKSRENWLKYGDNNTKFFHASTVVRRRQNRVSCIETSPNVWIRSRHDIGQYFQDKFQELYQSTNPVINEDLDTLFTVKFSGIFYMKSWNLGGPEVCKLVKEFFDQGSMSRQINRTFICLIPKENNASSFDKFRPISLCNFCYKIVARILTDRLKHIMDKLVSPNQSAFIPERWIAECSVLAQEVNHAIKNKKGKEGVMAVKTDMSKAYDRLEWNFIKRVLKANGFSDKATMLLMACISSVSFSILLNGAPLAPFNPNRGLRQGDPLSPFLFILCSEVLSKLIGKAEVDKKLKGIRVSRNATAISHLLYADDAIFYCQASEANATCLMEVFEKYEAWYGQRINKSKSGILFSPNTCDRKKGEIIAIMSMEKLRAKEKYLGNPFFFTGRRTKDFQFLKQKVLNHIDGWKAKCLSQAARTTLVSSVLQSIPTYFMSTSLVPKSTCEELDKLVARFWWVGLHPDKDKLLNAWVVEKKDQDSLIWKRIIQTRDVCLKGAGVVIANGDTDLWTTPWVPWKSMQEIKDSFSYNRIHAFHKVSNLFVDGTRQWNEGLIRSCFEEDVAKAILNVKPLREGKDKLFWKAAKSGNFSVKSAYWIHQHERFNESNSIWNKIWKTKLHPRLQLLMWKEETEDLMHIITRCNITRGLWFQSRWGLQIDQIGWNTIFAFINWWADIEDHELKVFAACLLDVLWFWRNKIAHNYTPWDMNLLAKEWLSRATEFSVLMQEVEISPPTSSPSHPSHVCQNIPVFQVDASVSGNDSGIAAILNTEGDWNDTLIALDFGMVHSVIEGELSAISLALSTAASKGFHKVAIESDCAVAIQGLQSGCFPVGWGSYPVFMDCMSKSREFESVVFSCIKRSSNHYADFLARRARIGKIHVVGSVREVAPLCGY
uniref:Reverse transcriptase domain-containing protein n=1 Tax=Cannabis sativa TaxID=3483 RepID=A0A803QHZ7_CANSA